MAVLVRRITDRAGRKARFFVNALATLPMFLYTVIARKTLFCGAALLKPMAGTYASAE
jgi:hypothetical protein